MLNAFIAMQVERIPTLAVTHLHPIVEKAILLGIIDGTEVSIEATKIDVYEKY